MKTDKLLGPDQVQFLRDTRTLAPYLRAARIRCPECDMPTIEDRAGLTHEDMLCDRCYLNWSREDQ